jgi:uncharacterized protein involved in exopolysaccharide biosynthesis
MQAPEVMGVQRRALDVEDYIDILRRHRAWIMGPLFGALVFSVMGAFLWPDTYASEASLRVLSPTLNESLAQSPISQTLIDRINSMASSIMSRSVLQTIILKEDLYPRDRARYPIDDVVESMRKDIRISQVQTLQVSNRQTVPAFTIRYFYQDRFKAQRVVQELVSRFMNANQQEQQSNMVAGVRFFQDQLEETKKILDEAETKLAQFRSAHNGQLPDQIQSNIQQLTALQQRQSIANAALSRATQEKMLLENNLSIEQDRRRQIKETVEVPQAEQAKNDRLQDLDREIRQLENAVAILKEQYTPNYPDLKAAISRLSNAKKERDELAKREESSKKDPATKKIVSPEAVKSAQEADANIRRLQGAIEAKALELEQLNRETREIASAIRTLDSRVTGMPLSEKQYYELLRERDSAKDRYNEAQVKFQKVNQGSNMIDRKMGEMLDLLDSPSLPQTATEPKRPVIIALGTALGLFVGLVLAGAREVKDTSLKNLKDVRAYTNMTILGSIPLLENDSVVRRRKRIAFLGWTIAILVGTAIMAGSIIYYFATKQ